MQHWPPNGQYYYCMGSAETDYIKANPKLFSLAIGTAHVTFDHHLELTLSRPPTICGGNPVCNLSESFNVKIDAVYPCPC